MKIYVLGDSFTDNLYKPEIEAIENNQNRISEIYRYIKNIKNQNLPYPLYFDDYLRLWGHEVINLGEGGCSNDSIFHQFTQIKEPFDRLIVNWTGLSRFDWYGKNDIVRTFTGGMAPGTELTTTDELLIEQAFNRLENKVYLKKTLDLFSFFVSKYEKQKPIIWTPIENLSKIIENMKGYIWNINDPFFKTIIPEIKRLEIYTETDKKINDRHYGRYGNFYTALIFETILEYTKDINHNGYYIQDSDLILKIKEKIKTTPHNIGELNTDLI